MIRVIVILALASAVANAHSAPSSEVTIVIGDHEARAELLLPASELAHVGVTDAVQLARYLPAHLAARTVDGATWTAALGEIRPMTIDGHASWSTTITWTPPAGADRATIVLEDDAITHEVRNHYIVVREGARLLGVMQYPQRRMTIGAEPTQRWRYVIFGAAALSALSLIRVAKRTQRAI